MATFDYNPLTGQLDLVGSGASYIDGVVADPTALPVTLGTPALDSVYLAKAGSGIWLINRRPAGLYCRTANNGNAADWTYLGAFPEVNADGNWELYNSADPTKELKFDLSGLPAATIRTVSAPAGNGQMLVEGQPIGSTTPDAGAFTTLTGSTQIIGPQGSTVGTASDCSITLGAANTGFRVSSTQPVFQKQGTTVWYANNSSRFVIAAGMVNGVVIEGTGAPLDFGGRTALYPEATNVLSQRYLANPQTFRLYNTFTDASNHERGFMRWSSNVLQIGTEKAGTGSARALEFQTDGTTRASVTTGGNFWVNNQLILGTAVPTRITSPSDGVVALFDSGQASFNRLQFGGTTSSFPALKRSSTGLQVRLADDSAYSVLDAQLRAQGTAPATTGATGTAGDIRYDADYIYVCTAANTWKRAAIATW